MGKSKKYRGAVSTAHNAAWFLPAAWFFSKYTSNISNMVNNFLLQLFICWGRKTAKKIFFINGSATKEGYGV